ncbi:MAG: hypothetical protein JWQ18_1167 [Conexibacter sp.]|nr:hypothetical protein [Conexibacter sp.]
MATDVSEALQLMTDHRNSVETATRTGAEVR